MQFLFVYKECFDLIFEWVFFEMVLIGFNDFVISMGKFVLVYIQDDKCCDNIYVYGNGFEFDNVILIYVMDVMGMCIVWKYGVNQSLCIVVSMGCLLLGIDFKYIFKFIGEKYYVLYDVCYEWKFYCYIMMVFMECFGIIVLVIKEVVL